MRYLILDRNGETINTIIADAIFVEKYCSHNGYTYQQLPDIEDAELVEPEVTTNERLTALEDSHAEMAEALELLLSGVTE